MDETLPKKSRLKTICILPSNLVSSKVVLTVKLWAVKLSLETFAVLITLQQQHELTNRLSASGSKTCLAGLDQYSCFLIFNHAITKLLNWTYNLACNAGGFKGKDWLFLQQILFVNQHWNKDYLGQNFVFQNYTFFYFLLQLQVI